MNGKPENRIERIVSDLLRGKRLKLRGGDADERAAIIAAARLAAARQGPQRMHPAFRKRLAQAIDQTPRSALVTRRAALVAGLGLAAGAAGGALLERAAKPPTTTAAGGEPIDPVKGTWVDVGAFSDLVEGQGKRVTAGGVSAYVFRRGESVTAVSSICSHLPCELWWDESQTLLACPCHPATFTTYGHSTEQSYPLPSLNVVHARVTPSGRVEVLGTA